MEREFYATLLTHVVWDFNDPEVLFAYWRETGDPHHIEDLIRRVKANLLSEMPSGSSSAMLSANAFNEIERGMEREADLRKLMSMIRSSKAIGMLQDGSANAAREEPLFAPIRC